MLLTDHKGRLTLSPFIFLLPELELPAEDAEAQQNQSSTKQKQAQDWDDGAVRVKGVSHSCHHHTSNQDHHAERHGAAVAGDLRPAGGC